MIIQCEQCRTKFRLDDEKVSDRGVKVRCAKCRHVFTVRKDGEQPEAAVAAVDGIETSAVAVSESTSPAAEPQVSSSTPAEPEVSFDFGSTAAETPAAVDNSFDLGQTDAATGGGFDFGDVAFSTEAPPAAPAGVDFGEMTMVMPPKQTADTPADFSLDFGTAAVQNPEPAPAADVGFDFGEAFATGSAVDATAQKMAFDFGDHPSAAVAPAGDVDLGGFDFGEAPAAVSAPTASIDAIDFSTFSETSAPKAAAAGEAGFAFEDAVAQPPAASSDSFDFSGVDFGTATPAAAAAPSEVDSFSLGDMDFSGDTSAVAVDAAAAPAGTLFAPVEATVAEQQKAATPEITFEAPAAPEEAPPLAITSRRRQSSTLSMVIAAVTVVVVGVLGYMAYTFISDGPKAVSMFGKETAPAEDGKITVQNVKAYFVPKAAAGELLVITGDALNSYKKPRAALQVKGMVFGANNQALATKTAYAGNQLSQEQLAAMPAEKIEAAMNNQFGDSLANLEVQPGKTIPFTIVIINPPAEGKDFGVEPVGSTVAASK